MKGCKNILDQTKFFTQENNAIEAYNKTQRAEGLNHWTESCGPSSLVNIISAMGSIDQVYEKLSATGMENVVATPGGWNPQPEDVLFLYLNDPRNFSKFKAVYSDLEPGTVAGNRVRQWFPIAMQEVFGVKCQYIQSLTFDQVKDFVSAGHGVQICLITPGHYLAVIGYDEATDELIFWDSFGSRFADGKGGFNRRLSRKEYQSNVKPHFVVF